MCLVDPVVDRYHLSGGRVTKIADDGTLVAYFLSTADFVLTVVGIPPDQVLPYTPTEDDLASWLIMELLER